MSESQINSQELVYKQVMSIPVYYVIYRNASYVFISRLYFYSLSTFNLSRSRRSKSPTLCCRPYSTVCCHSLHLLCIYYIFLFTLAEAGLSRYCIRITNRTPFCVHKNQLSLVDNAINKLTETLTYNNKIATKHRLSFFLTHSIWT